MQPRVRAGRGNSHCIRTPLPFTIPSHSSSSACLQGDPLLSPRGLAQGFLPSVVRLTLPKLQYSYGPRFLTALHQRAWHEIGSPRGRAGSPEASALDAVGALRSGFGLATLAHMFLEGPGPGQPSLDGFDTAGSIMVRAGGCRGPWGWGGGG